VRLLLALLAAAAACVESVSLTAFESRLAVRVVRCATPGLVAVHREGDVSGTSLADAHQLSGDVRRDLRSLLIDDRQAPEEAPPERVSRAAPTPEPPAPHVEPSPGDTATVDHPAAVPLSEPPPAPGAVVTPASTPAAEQPAAPAPDTAELARRLFGAVPAESPEEASVAELYPRLFPTGAPQTQPPESPAAEVMESSPETGVPVGPFRVRAGVDARYVDADTFVESTAVPTRDHYLEVQPRLTAAAPLGAGHFTLDYAPVIRTFATYDEVNSDSHTLGGGVDLPVGGRVTVRARDRFRSGVLDTRVVDPGGEYFFGLGHFRRNDVDMGASILVGPRLSVELGGALGTVRFQQESNFFDYDTRSAQAGLGFEVLPNLKAVASYVYDTVPRPDQRPVAESTAHSGDLSLSGEILPLLTGDVTVGYRSQTSPGAGPGGTSYSGLTLSAALTRELGRESALSVYASRATPVSAYEQNAFYVSSALQGTLLLPLPTRLQFRGGLGYQWNDYRTVASPIGRPREDRILGWYAGLRRPVRHNLFLSAIYRRENRNSNVDGFDTNANGFYFQLEWDVFGTPAR